MSPENVWLLAYTDSKQRSFYSSDSSHAKQLYVKHFASNMLFFKTTVWVSLSWVDIIHALLICTHVSHLKGATDTPLWVYLTSNLHKSIHKCILYNKSFNFIRGPYKKHRHHYLSNYVIMALIRICVFCMSSKNIAFVAGLYKFKPKNN